MKEQMHKGLPWFGIPKLYPYLKTYGSLLFWMVFMGLVASGADVAVPLFQQYAIDHFIADKTMQGIWGFVGLYVLVIGFQIVSNYISAYGACKAELYIGRDLRRAAFDHLQTLSFSYFNQNSVGYVHARVMSDTDRIASTLAWGIMEGVWYIAYLIFAVAMMFILNWKLALCVMVIGAVINIILDPILIFGFGLGVQGAAIATVLSQAVGAAWILRFLTGKKTILRLRKDYLRPEKQVILPVLALGISTFVMLSTESLLSISFSSSLARYGGDVAVGAMTVITSASQLCTLPIQGVCQGGQPVMSFNFGAGKKPRVKEAFRFQLTLCGAYTCLFWLAMMLAPGAVAGIFTSDSALISYTTWAMRIYMAGIFAMGFQIACQQSFMALGQAKVSLLLACLRKIILLIPLIFILPHVVSDPVFGVFLAEPVSDILAATITTITFFARFDKILDQGAARV